jgi:hypothetical protein
LAPIGWLSFPLRNKHIFPVCCLLRFILGILAITLLDFEFY